MKCAILDYGTGNLQSVQNAIEHLGHDAFRINNFDDISSVDVLIFPGQGAFGPAMHQLESMNLIRPLQQYVASKKPFIGICLGFQLLFNGSSESEKDAGLNCLDGYFNRFSGNELSIPHMGWNTIHATNTNTILDGFNNERFYFVHSYFLPTSSDRNIATTNYGVTFYIRHGK